MCVCIPQIKGTFRRTYTDAVLNYNAEDEASRAVDNLQHKVSTMTQQQQVTTGNKTSWLLSHYPMCV